MLVAEQVSLAEKERIAKEFLETNPCCLEVGFSGPLREAVASANDILPGGRFHVLLKSAFQGLPYNIGCENSFARIKGMQKCNRGRTDLTSSLCAKHLLAEAKTSHLTSLNKNSTVPKETMVASPAEQVLPLQNETGGQHMCFCYKSFRYLDLEIKLN